jgi:hypothetical protein
MYNINVFWYKVDQSGGMWKGYKNPYQGYRGHFIYIDGGGNVVI